MVMVAAVKPGLAETPMTIALNNGLPWGRLELIAAKNVGYPALALRRGRDRSWLNDMLRRITATWKVLFDDRPPRLRRRFFSFP